MIPLICRPWRKGVDKFRATAIQWCYFEELPPSKSGMFFGKNFKNANVAPNYENINIDPDEMKLNISGGPTISGT